jgi:hypothetical protein
MRYDWLDTPITWRAVFAGLAFLLIGLGIRNAIILWLRKDTEVEG